MLGGAVIDVCTMYFFKSGGDEYMYIRHDWPEPHMNVVYILFFGGDFLKYTGSYTVYIYGTTLSVYRSTVCAARYLSYTGVWKLIHCCVETHTLMYGNPSYTAVWKLVLH